jgi:ATP/maltotriose-dependent transcriptional regulator MalT
MPGHLNYLNTLGVAQYRVGAYEEALMTLSRSDAMRSRSSQEAHPADVAFLAMACRQLGQIEAAKTHLERLRSLMKRSRYASDESCQRLVQEAESLLAAGDDSTGKEK